MTRSPATGPRSPILITPSQARSTRGESVVSRSLERVTWNNSSLVKGDVVAELRQLQQQPGRSLQSWGSTDLLQTLLKNDLIDEYRLFIFPVVLGSGKRLFGSGTVPVALKQVESVTSAKGGTYHRLEVSGKPEYGVMGA